MRQLAYTNAFSRRALPAAGWFLVVLAAATAGCAIPCGGIPSVQRQAGDEGCASGSCSAKHQPRCHLCGKKGSCEHTPPAEAAGGEGVLQPPWPKYHPVPTRPVFAPDEDLQGAYQQLQERAANPARSPPTPAP